MTDNPIIEVILKHRTALTAAHFDDDSGENKRIIEEAASKMVPRLAWTLGDEDDDVKEQKRNNDRAKWLAYNLLLDICDSK